MTAPSNDPKLSNHKRRNVWLAIIAAIFLLLGLGWLLYWFFIGRFYVSTDDAYVNGNEVFLTSQIPSGVRAIYADDTDLVEKGQLIVELDRTDYEIQFEELKEELAATVRKVAQLFLNVGVKETEVALRFAELRQAKLDAMHRIGLPETGAISIEEFEQYQTDVAVREAQLAFAEKELEVARQMVEGTTIKTHPFVLDAIQALKEAYLNLIRCQIWAPVTGYVAKRTVQVGDQIEVGEPLLFIVPLDCIWLNANYKETRLKHIRIGQPVEFTSDMYGRGVRYHGQVIGFQPGTGNAFALLPPENASGNWIKIIQRVPVRISIDPEELKEHPLFLGLSLHTHVDVHDQSGKRLSEIPSTMPIYTTSIYDQQVEMMEKINPFIENIIRENYFINETDN